MKTIWTLLLLAFCTIGNNVLAQDATAAELPPIRNFMQVTKDFCTGGQPRLEHLDKLKAQGVKAIINLRPSGEHRAAEEEAKAKESGLRYINIPVVYTDPKEEQATEFLKATDDPANRPAFVHCAAAIRAGAFMMIRRVLRDGLSIDQAEAEAKQMGLVNAPHLVEFARAYIAKHQTSKVAPGEGKKKMTKEIATLGGGCFWCTEAVFKELKGVDRVVSGYTGGHVKNPTYKEVCTGTTGHAEVIQVQFDPAVISFKEILEVFFTVHDPTTLNRQGADVGTQYRSAIFYHSPEQKTTAEQVKQAINEAKIWDHPIVTEITAIDHFYPAEDYHQNYFELNPEQGYCRVVIAPKVNKFRKQFMSKLKKQPANH